MAHFLPPALIAAEAHPKPIFSNVTTEAGITWRHFNGISPDRYLIETMGGGVGFFDFDGDGMTDSLWTGNQSNQNPHPRESGIQIHD